MEIRVFGILLSPVFDQTLFVIPGQPLARASWRKVRAVWVDQIALVSRCIEFDSTVNPERASRVIRVLIRKLRSNHFTTGGLDNINMTADKDGIASRSLGAEQLRATTRANKN